MGAAVFLQWSASVLLGLWVFRFGGCKVFGVATFEVGMALAVSAASTSLRSGSRDASHSEKVKPLFPASNK